MSNTEITKTSRFRSLFRNRPFDWAAIDIETATDFDSPAQYICAIAVCQVQGSGRLMEPEKFLVRPPENKISPRTTEIHKITPEQTENAPSFQEIWPEIASLIYNRVLVAHNADFDFRVIEQELRRNYISPQPNKYSCTLDMARATWPDAEGFRLNMLCERFGIPLNHHDPGSDAQAAATLMLEIYSATRRENIISASQKLGVAVGVLGRPPRWPRGYRPWENRAHFKKRDDAFWVCGPPDIMQADEIVEVRARSGNVSYIKLGSDFSETMSSAGGQLFCNSDWRDLNERELEKWLSGEKGSL